MRVSTSYGPVAKTLHWVIALAILGMIGIGYVMTRMPDSDPDKFALFQLHKSIGITILLLSLCRVAWRLTHPAPVLPLDMAKWERLLTKAVIFLFYVLMIGIPFLGWMIVSSSPLNLPTLLFGTIPWPHLPILPDLNNKRELSHAFGAIHVYMAYSVLFLLCLHIGGALKHHFIKRDDVLVRMMPECLNPFLNWLRRLIHA